MKLSNWEEEFDVPCEFEETQSTEKNMVKSPKTKSSKLWLDKGFVKENDDIFEGISFINKSSTQRIFRNPKNNPSSLGFENNCKSSVNLWKKIESPVMGFKEEIDLFEQQEQTKPNERRMAYQRKRIQSFNNEEFMLVPLLRKVSWDPTSADNTNLRSALKSSSPEKKLRKVSFNLEIDEGEENDENSVSDEPEDKNFLVTIGDVFPGKIKTNFPN